MSIADVAVVTVRFLHITSSKRISQWPTHFSFANHVFPWDDITSKRTDFTSHLWIWIGTFTPLSPVELKSLLFAKYGSMNHYSNFLVKIHCNNTNEIYVAYSTEWISKEYPILTKSATKKNKIYHTYNLGGECFPRQSLDFDILYGTWPE